MKIGESVKVKKGIKSPDYKNLSIAGWVGRIDRIHDNILTIELDSITLSGLPESYIMDSIVNNVECTFLNLGKDEVEPISARDSERDTALKQMAIHAKYSSDEEEKRIRAILKTDDLSINETTLDTYYDYLETNLKAPCTLTGMEDFEWEEPYVFGGWNQKEYKELKKTRPSYTDRFEFLNLEGCDDLRGIYIKAKRMSDKKRFSIPLWDLEVVDEDDPNFQLVSDYSSWMSNYR